MSDTKSLSLTNKKRGLLWPIVIATVFASGFIIYGYIKSNALNERHAEYNHQVRNTASSESLVSAFKEAFEICVEANHNEQNAVCQKFDSFIAGQLAAQDLMAQRSMAIATEGILQATTEQLWLSFISTAFLFLTVGTSLWVLLEAKATTGAAIRAANAAENSESAFVDMQLRLITTPTESDGDDRTRLQVEIINYGKTPALSVSYRASNTREGVEYFCEDSADVVPPNKQSPITEVLTTETDNELSLESDRSKNIGDRFNLEWSYSTVFSNTVVEKSYVAVFDIKSVNQPSYTKKKSSTQDVVCVSITEIVIFNRTESRVREITSPAQLISTNETT